MLVTLPASQVIRVDEMHKKDGSGTFFTAQLLSGREIFELFVPAEYVDDFKAAEGQVMDGLLCNVRFANRQWRVYPAWRD